jgi:signal transduction histidine kinase
VLLNLIINAIEASPDSGTVLLAASSEYGKITIRVVDEGSGVAPEDVEKLFDPFFTTKESGTGLGLSVAHQIVNQMGGQLTARRNADRGMTFSVVLPVRQRNAA